ncbi:hypothetical protein ATANTOWER_031105 [Ataeniobius toweri]|uniref:Uncharacterized protein n=1 Tax=Ataeniobius toweri TaxID=208326 RepID=A0ABU7CAP4_9TELE|nr:hypothetical protein [Ataeniobius toweri]
MPPERRGAALIDGETCMAPSSNPSVTQVPDPCRAPGSPLRLLPSATSSSCQSENESAHFMRFGAHSEAHSHLYATKRGMFTVYL